MRRLFVVAMLLLAQFAGAQETDTLQLNFKEYLAIVKKYHPLVKQADLVVDEGSFKLMKARGSFDPKVEANLSEKNYKSTEYYNLFGAAFKIPTYYGLELNAKYEKNSGYYLNPENTVPENGLYSAGVILDVTNGIFMSERMATLRQAKIYREQTQLKRDLQAAEVLYNASATYFEWFAAYQELQLYQNFKANSEFTLRSVKSQFKAGDKPAVDTLEAGINKQNRTLQLEQARLDYLKASLKLSNYLWAEDNIPLEITQQVRPNENLPDEVDDLWFDDQFLAEQLITENPKIRSLQYDVEMMQVEKRLRANKLLPDLNLSYNFLTEQPEKFNSLNTENYKFGFSVNVPLFLRKERGDLQLAKVKLQNYRLELINAHQEIQNKLTSLENEIISYRAQSEKMNVLVNDYSSLVDAERRKFELGDSSLFLVNSRENYLITARLKEISLQGKYIKSLAQFLKLTTRF